VLAADAGVEAVDDGQHGFCVAGANSIDRARVVEQRMFGDQPQPRLAWLIKVG